MKKNWLLIGGILLLAIGAVLMVYSARRDPAVVTALNDQPHPATEAPPAHNHGAPGSTAQAVPAFYEVAPSRASLAPTLAPEKFTGPTREAYRAAKEIPVTLAQLPCYCHCDRGFGHKSLYSCFEDDHASHCATCVNEALLALRLEKEKKLTPAQIREQIVAEFGQ